MAFSLVTRVGMKDEVRDQIVSLCGLINIEPQEAIEIGNRLHDTSGLVARKGRFFYVTPQIVAQAAFDMAWTHWLRDDPESFLRQIPSAIIPSFLERVKGIPSPQIRQIVSGFFSQSFQFTPQDLQSSESVARLVNIVLADPAAHLPLLNSLINNSTIEELRGNKGHYSRGGWGPRRKLVWLLEDLAAFPEYFALSEDSLLRLAVAESEPSIANNATGIWSRLFRIRLSGTAVPFFERLDLSQSHS